MSVVCVCICVSYYIPFAAVKKSVVENAPDTAKKYVFVGEENMMISTKMVLKVSSEDWKSIVNGTKTDLGRHVYLDNKKEVPMPFLVLVSLSAPTNKRSHLSRLNIAGALKLKRCGGAFGISDSTYQLSEKTRIIYTVLKVHCLVNVVNGARYLQDGRDVKQYTTSGHAKVPFKIMLLRRELTELGKWLDNENDSNLS